MNANCCSATFLHEAELLLVCCQKKIGRGVEKKEAITLKTFRNLVQYLKNYEVLRPSKL